MIIKLKALIKKLYFFFMRIGAPKGLKYLGEMTIFRKPLRIIGRKYIYVGSGCDIMDGLRVEAVSQWNGKIIDPPPLIQINDHVIIGQYCHITAANKIIIGEGTTILPNVLITDIEHIKEKNKPLFSTDISIGSVTIGKYVQIGMGARIMANGKDIIIGDNAIIGANAVVTKSVEENATVVGIPATIL